MLHWLEEIKGLGSAPLTVRAQALSLEQVDPLSQLAHPVFFPYKNVDSVDITEITATDKRYVADRREWNATGRYVPQDTPSIVKTSMVPIESYDKIDEYEQQKLLEKASLNEALFRQMVGASIPDRVNKLVSANYRRVEVDAMDAWANGAITAKNAQTGTTQSFSLGFAGARYTTAATAWNDGGVNAYSLCLAFIGVAEGLVGQVAGLMMRSATFAAIQADSPNNIAGAQSALLPTRRQIEAVISAELGYEFKFVINERTVDVFNDGGTAVTRSAVWTAQKVAAIPAGFKIGDTMRAPVGRAVRLASQFPGSGIDDRGMTVFYDYENNGKTAVIECQANWLPLPAEYACCVIDAGV